LGIASLLSALDVSVISTAMPSIIKDLGSAEAYIWITNAYFLTMTAFQPLYGQTANIFGRRWLTLIAVFLFAVGSARVGNGVQTRGFGRWSCHSGRWRRGNQHSD
jgi:MFS family permease